MHQFLSLVITILFSALSFSLLVLFGDKNPNEKVIEPVIVDQQVDNKGSVVFDGSYVEKNWQDVVKEFITRIEMVEISEENRNPIGYFSSMFFL